MRGQTGDGGRRIADGSRKVVVSACLAGVRCRHDGLSRANPTIVEMVRRGEAVPVCPELLAGLGVPRPTVAFVSDALEQVTTAAGRNVTVELQRGAQATLRVARAVGATGAVLKERSPSCGVRSVYRRRADGTEEVVPGQGLAARQLHAAGLEVTSDEELSI